MIIGKPLAGKDTQADLLVTAHPKEATKISPGQLIREVEAEGVTHRFFPIIGPYISMMQKGLKLPDEPTLEMIDHVITEKIREGKTLLVIAGSPRGLVQLEGFDEIAKKHHSDAVFIHMDATDEETYKRSAGRNEGRVDDTPEIHAVRLEEYRTHVLPVVEALTDDSRYVHLDGMMPQEVLHRQLEHELMNRMRDVEITLPAMARR